MTSESLQLQARRPVKQAGLDDVNPVPSLTEQWRLRRRRLPTSFTAQTGSRIQTALSVPVRLPAARQSRYVTSGHAGRRLADVADAGRKSADVRLRATVAQSRERRPTVDDRRRLSVGD